MNKYIKKFFAVTILFCIVVDASADRGIGKKSKSRPTLNITAPSNLKNSITLNLKSGLSYKGSLLNTRKSLPDNSIINSSIVTYKKGNTTYIIPYKSKITVADVRQGYTGMKIIIRKK